MEKSYQYSVVEKAIDFIDGRSDQQPSLAEIAGHVHMSKYHFQRVFKKWVGISPKNFLEQLTLERAKTALNRGKTTLETAYDVGLSGNGRLHDLFIKIEACTPGDYQRGGRDLTLRMGEIETPFGMLAIAESDIGICRMSFTSTEKLRRELKKDYPFSHLIDGFGANSKKVIAYLNNWQIPEEPILLEVPGTTFQIQVWKALLQIPSAQLASYGDIAKAIGKPGSARAVGSAVAKNPVAYLIPCHRVIQNSGLSGEYRWGRGRKKLINAYESSLLSDNSTAEIS